jgi:hypothetical protein
VRVAFARPLSILRVASERRTWRDATPLPALLIHSYARAAVFSVVGEHAEALMHARALLIGLALLGAPHAAQANPDNPVADWAAIAQQAIHNATAPRSAGSSEILHTTVMLAIYDAVVAIEGGYMPYTAAIEPAPWADVKAAVATAAWRTARARVAASQVPALDQQYNAYLANVPDSFEKTEGVRIGTQAADQLLAARADDRFNSIVLFECRGIPTAPGDYEPDAGCPTGPTSPQPVDVKVGRILPFTLGDATRYRPNGLPGLSSAAYATDFIETRDLGRATSDVRTAEQTDIAYFWSENPYVHWNRNLIALARAQQLDALGAARLFALVHVSVSDAIIVGFEAKYHYASWRPRTAIPRADEDDNPATDADPAWRPLLMVNHPEYPSGHGFWSTALANAVGSFFGSNRVTWTITTSKTAVPALVQTERTYTHLNKLTHEIGNARIWGGLHWRTSIKHGEQIGRRVAAHVEKHFFTPVP